MGNCVSYELDLFPQFESRGILGWKAGIEDCALGSLDVVRKAAPAHLTFLPVIDDVAVAGGVVPRWADGPYIDQALAVDAQGLGTATIQGPVVSFHPQHWLVGVAGEA